MQTPLNLRLISLFALAAASATATHSATMQADAPTSPPAVLSAAVSSVSSVSSAACAPAPAPSALRESPTKISAGHTVAAAAAPACSNTAGAVSMPRDAATGQSTGKRQHSPSIIVK